MKFVAALLFAGCALGEEPSMTFLAVGDWGGTDSSPFTEVGQVAAAKGMAQKAEEIGARFVLALGDNFYSHGIESDANDARFQQTFEDVYTEDSLDVPWFVVGGNHDWAGNVSAQIAYTEKSERWTFPDYWYSVEEEFTEPDGTARTFELLMIDTVIGVGQVTDHDDPRAQVSGVPFDRDLADQQAQWLATKLAKSDADYLWVGGHYPVWSACSHGPTNQLVADLAPVLQQFGANYMSGHDHCEEYISDAGVEYILTGNGDNCCYDATNLDKIPTDSLKYITSATMNSTEGMTGGFTSWYFDSEGMRVQFHDQDAAVLYETPTFKPRSDAIKEAARSRLSAELAALVVG